MSKFTPGPWSYDPYDNAIIKEKIEDIAFIARTNENGENDRNLIIAAPEMYEALEAVTDFMRDTGMESSDEYAIAEAALNKANGDSCTS